MEPFADFIILLTPGNTRREVELRFTLAALAFCNTPSRTRIAAPPRPSRVERVATVCWITGSDLLHCCTGDLLQSSFGDCCIGWIRDSVNFFFYHLRWRKTSKGKGKPFLAYVYEYGNKLRRRFDSGSRATFSRTSITALSC